MILKSLLFGMNNGFQWFIAWSAFRSLKIEAQTFKISTRIEQEIDSSRGHNKLFSKY